MAASYQMLFELNAAMGGGFTSAFTQGSQQIENMKAKLDSLNSMGSTGDLLGGISSALSAVGVMQGLQSIYDTLQDCAQASIEFESAMTGVSKTTDLSASELEEMSAAVMRLSTEIPVTTTELANVMEVAGQLGIGKENLLDFSTTMSQLATATTMTADEAATMLAQFANITQMDPSQYSNLASAVVDLGNNYATTEQKIVEMGQGIAASGSLAGMSEADMMGLSAAVTSLGIETAAGSTSMSKLISQINMAVETGNGLDQFASVAGMSATQFAQAWGDDAANALATFVTGLNDVERNGASATVILSELGITETRMQRMILSLAGSGDLMANAIRDANSAFAQNTALSAEAEKRYATTESRLTMLSNAANNVKISIGDALTPVIGGFAEGLTGILEPMAEFIEQNPAIVQGITTFVTVLGVAAGAVAAYTAATKLAAAANLLFGGSIPGVGIIMGLAVGLGALVTGIGLISDAIHDANPSFEELDAQFDELNDKAKEQQAIIDLAQEYRDLSADIANTEAAIKFKAELDIGDVTPENLKLIDELKEKMENKKARLVQWLDLIGADDISDDDMARLIELAANAQTSDDILKQELALYTTGDITDDSIATLRSFAEAIVTDSGALEEELRLIGFDDATIASMGYGSYKDFIDDVAAGNLVVNDDGTITERIDLGGVAPDDLTLIKEIAENNGYAVSEDGVVTQTLSLEGVKDNDLKTLERLKKDVTNAEAKLVQGLELVGVEKVTQEKLNRYLQLKVNTDDGDHELRQMLSLEGTENVSEYRIKQIKEYIKTVQNKQGKVTQKMEAIVDEASIKKLGYSTMQDFIAAVNAGEVIVNEDGTITQIIDVSGDVEELKQAWENENALAEAEAASTAAADELAAKRERLKVVTDELRSSSGGLISATDEETDALNRQIDAYESIARAKKEQYTAQALDTVTKQTKHYVDSVKAANDADAAMGRAQAKSDIITSFKDRGEAIEYLRGEYQDLQTAVDSYEGSNWLIDENAEAAALRDRFLGLQETLNGVSTFGHDLWDSWIDPMGELGYAIENDVMTNEQLLEGWQQASEEAAKYGDVIKANKETQNEYIQNLVNGVTEGTMTTEQLRTALLLAMGDAEDGAAQVDAIMAEVEKGIEAAKAAAEGSGSTVQSEAETTVQAVGNIITQIEALKKAYDEAKASALSALSGRFGLFDEVGEGAESQTTQQMEANMQAQTTYWDQYNKNLQTALDKGLAPEIAKQLADGSAESAASLKTLADASEEEIQAINDSFAEAEAMKDTLASTIADMETNFSEGMEALKTELENTVKELDKGSEAAEAAAATMEAYVASLEAAEGDASTQAQAIADAVNAALATIADVDVNINYHENGKPSGTGVDGHDAIGTDYANRGIHLVGEEGPELVYMSGGEKVLTANETVNALSGSGSGEGTSFIQVSFPTNYNVNGGDAQAITKVLEEHDAELRDKIESIMEDLSTDRMRVSFS